jgi:hypothetical protein
MSRRTSGNGLAGVGDGLIEVARVSGPFVSGNKRDTEIEQQPASIGVTAGGRSGTIGECCDGLAETLGVSSLFISQPQS